MAWVITTNHPASSHGAPVLVENERAYGPADLLEDGALAAHVVEQWATKPERTDKERDKADLFLRTWPQGPQLTMGLTEAAARLGVTRQSLFYRIRNGHMKGMMINEQWRIPWNEIKNYAPIKPGRK